MPSPTITRDLRLPASEYGREKFPKHLGVLHHTVGGSAKSSFQHWVDTPGSVATADLVERTGTVLEVFPPECWAIHLFRMDALPLGVRAETAKYLERHSYGVEIASEGALTYQNTGGPDSDIYAFDGKKYLGKASQLLAAGRILRMPTPWRGYQYFDAYDLDQVTATIQLVLLRGKQLGIPPVLHPGVYNPDAVRAEDWLNFKGWVTHALLRPDKSDVHLGFPFERLEAALAGRPFYDTDRLD